ncbi:hypothetical protein ACFXPX_05045 [Kitasatospora sp. NPDC059146]|uniref:hypothetical protein n=1 Tax=unclassified Kitasatospora TaxID=2633591 RepID=UPI0036B92EF9
MKKMPRFLPELGAIALLAGGLALLLPAAPAPHHPAAGAPVASAPADAPAGTADTGAPAPPPAPVPEPTRAEPRPAATPNSAAPSPSAASTVVPSGVAAAGDGPAGDPAIQAGFAKAHPSDLAPPDADALAALGRDVWLAETTGAGREKWPQYFSPGPGASAPYFYSGVRIQAAAAHSDPAVPGGARVDLLWTGTSPTGDYGDRRPATVTFTRTRTSTGWEPTR